MKTTLALLAIFTLTTLGFAAPPPNDNFANRQVVTGLVNILTINNMDQATTESGEPNTLSGYPYSVWYEWTAPDDGKVQFDGANSQFTHAIDVYFGGTLNTLKYIGGNQPGGTTYAKYVLPVTKGSTYVIRYRSYSGYPYTDAGEVGYLGINLRTDTQYNGIPLQRTSTVNNDLFANRVKIVKPSATMIGYNAFASNESGEPNSSTGPYSVWWEYTFPANGRAVIQRGTESDANILCVFTGSQIGSLTLGLRDTSRRQIVVTGTAGDTIQISMGSGFNTGSAIFGLSFTQSTATRDLNGDGNADILLQNAAGQVYAWYMDGSGGIASGGYIYGGGLPWKVVGVADMNNDGNADILLQNGAGQVYVWYMNGTGGITSGAYIYGAGLPFRVAGAADMNNDRNVDILLQNAGGQVYVW
jgi:hypothetical protein